MFHETKLNIEWSSEGEWNFTVGNQEIMKIRGGVKSSLGFQGGELFLLEVWTWTRRRMNVRMDPVMMKSVPRKIIVLT